MACAGAVGTCCLLFVWLSLFALSRAQVVNVADTTVTGEVNDMRWLGDEARIVLAKTKLGIVFRSADEGRTWKRLGPDKENKVVSIATSTADKGRMLLVGEGDPSTGQSTQWVSTDGGIKFYKARADITIREVKFHPNPEVAGHALAFKHEGCEAGKACLGSLLLTTNSGGTWREIAQDIVFPHYDWAQRVGMGAERQAIMAIQATRNEATISGWNPDRQFIRTNNLFGTRTVTLEKANKFVVVGKYLFVACAESYSHVSLWVSSDQGTTFRRVRVAVNMKQRGYDLLKGSEFTTLVSMRLGHSGVDYGSLYTSDSSGSAWALSLANNQHLHNGAAALARVKGVDGVYLTNQLVNTVEVDEGKPAKLRTIVSFDDGGKWLPMVPPDYDSLGKPYPCSKELGGSGCALHLYFRGNPQGYPPVYSTENAVGLLLATGWVGPFGESEEGEKPVATFLSRDAGWTWVEIRKGAHTYDMGDHGALLVLARHKQESTKLIYSWNEGKSWEEIALPKPLVVTNIVTHPNSTSQVFVALAGEEIAVADFSGLHQRPCHGADKPNEAGSDYELWNPRLPMLYFEGSAKNPRSDCLMGQKVVYTRRKRESACFNGQEHEKRVVEKTCACTKADYECDVLYERAMSNSEKVYANGLGCEWAGAKALAEGTLSKNEEEFRADLAKLAKTELTLDAVCAKHPGRDTLQVLSGYRKITGNKCSGGVDLGEQVMHCTSDSTSPEEDDQLPTGATEDEPEIEPAAAVPEDVDPLPRNGESPVSFRQEAEVWMTRVERQPKQVLHLEHKSSASAVVFALSQTVGTLSRSVNGGQTWEDCSEDLPGFILGADTVFSVVQSPVDPQLLVFVGSDLVSWRTTNGGETFEQVSTSFPLRIGGIKWHPTKRTHALAYQHPEECLQQARSVRCYGELMLSKDSARTWESIAKNVKMPNFEWAVSAWPKVTPDAIFAVMHSGSEGAKSWDTGLSMYLSNDFFVTKKTLSHGNNFVVVDHKIFVAAAKSMSEVELWVSGGDTFHRTQIPIDLPHRGYGLLNTQDGSVLVSVRSGGTTVRYGTVLQSHGDQLQWSLTLKHVSHQNGRPTEIAKVHGVDGIYMANVVTNPLATDKGAEPRVQTMITYDRGSFWHRLKPPSHDHKGHLFSCNSMDLCTLNVFFEGNERGFPALFTSNNATGLVLANGHVGESLSEKSVLSDDISTFLSRDGGWTWVEMRKGAHVVAIGDHGGLILMAPFQKSTSRLYFTSDEGASWGSVFIAKKGSQHEVYVTAIKQADPGLGQRFLVIGKLRGSAAEGVLLTVDFSSLHKRDCMGEDTPGEEGSDFERWAPKQGCVLGSRTYYSRRKPHARCFNRAPLERVVEKENCECTDEDFECAPGFTRRDGDKCEMGDPSSLPKKSQELHAVFKNRQLVRELCLKYSDQKSFQLISGWQRIRGDTCVRGHNREDVVVDCPDFGELGEGRNHMLKTVVIRGAQKGVTTRVTRIEDDIREVVWVVDDSKVLSWALGSSSGMLSRSVDLGKTWSGESAKLSGSLEIKMDSEMQSGVAKVIPAPLVKSAAFLVGYGSTHWLTTDLGASYQVSSLKQLIENQVTWHPTQRKTLLAYQHDPECEHDLNVCFGSVLLSLDSGMSWEPVLERVKYPNFGWDTSSAHNIMAVQHKSKSSMSRSNGGAWDPEFQLVRRKLGADNEPEVVLEGGNNFAVLGAHCFVARAESSTQVSLWVTNGEQPLKRAQFPAELAQRSYAVLDSARSGAIFLSVRDGDPDIKFSSLYLSDSTGHSWSISLKHTHHEPGYGVDLAKVHGFEGVFLANQVLNPSGTRQGEPTQLQTVITFDQGGEWFPIMPPKADAEGKPFLCEGSKCRLHLLFPNNKQGLYGVYSPENANGLVLATGFVGPPDAPNDINPNEVSLFLSRDAGRSWAEILKGPHVYEIADHGALIAAARFGIITNEVLYTWDQGLTWKSISVPASEVTNIVTQPASNSQHFVALCRKITDDASSGTHHSALVTLDLSSLHKRKCAGFNTAGTPGSDFEIWSPHQAKGAATKCIMGESVDYIRRKRTHECFYGEGQEGTAGRSQACECTKDDFVCSPGFERYKQRCVYQGMPEQDQLQISYLQKLHELYWDDSKLPDVCRVSNSTAFLHPESGFMLEPGNKCQKGHRYKTKKLGCEANWDLEEEIEYKYPSLLYLGILGPIAGALGYFGYNKWVVNNPGEYSKVMQESVGLKGMDDDEQDDAFEQHFGFDDFEDDLIEAKVKY